MPSHYKRTSMTKQFHTHDNHKLRCALLNIYTKHALNSCYLISVIKSIDDVIIETLSTNQC